MSIPPNHSKKQNYYSEFRLPLPSSQYQDLFSLFTRPSRVQLFWQCFYLHFQAWWGPSTSWSTLTVQRRWSSKAPLRAGTFTNQGSGSICSTRWGRARAPVLPSAGETIDNTVWWPNTVSYDHRPWARGWKKVHLVILRDLDVNEDHDSLVQKLAVFERNISEENGWSKRSLCRNSTNNRLLIQRSKTTEAYGIYLMYVTIALSISCFQLHPNVKCTAEEKNGFSKGKSPLFVSIIEG